MDGNSEAKFPCKNCITLAICKGRTRKIIETEYKNKSWVTMAEMACIVTYKLKDFCPIILEYIATLKYVEKYHDYGNFQVCYYAFMRNRYF